jgi:hypothetical protein
MDSAVTARQNFEKDTILDSDGDEIPKEKMVDFRAGGQDSGCRSRLGNRTQNQVLPLWGAITGRTQNYRARNWRGQKRKSATGWMRYGVGWKKTRISALPNNSLDTARIRSKNCERATRIQLNGGEITILKASV